LRKGGGTVCQKNKYQIERQKHAERQRMKQLGIAEPIKPKTQKIIFMEQWREKQKKKEKMERKKIAIPQSNEYEQHKNIKINNQHKAKSFELNTKSSSNKNVPNFDAMKLLKQKRKKMASSHQHNIQKSVSPNVQRIDYDDNEQKTSCDELTSCSKFEDLGNFEDAILVKQQHQNQVEEKKQNDSEIGIWTKPKLPKKSASNQILREQRIKSIIHHILTIIHPLILAVSLQ